MRIGESVNRMNIMVAVTTSQTRTGEYSYYSYDASSKTRRSPVDLPNLSLAKSFARSSLSRRRRTPETDLTISSNMQKQEQPVINTNPKVASVNVTYSTDDGSSSPSTSAFSTVVTTPAAPPVGAVEQTKPGKNVSFVVSQPMNPAVGLPPRGVIWPNRTMSKNVTDQPQGESRTPQSTPDENSDIDDISIDKFSINKFEMNKTLTQNNVTNVEEDTHLYYNSTIVTNETIGKQLWVDMDNHPDVKVNDVLSQSYRRAATVKLKFDFPFYGHKVRNITIATGGFLYTGEYVHSWLAATQYIAPLMANFDTRLSNESFVKYADNETAFTVEWDKVILQDKPNAGPFTFQATLHQNGDIVFVYSVVPLVVENIEDTEHPVKVGLSDAYIMDRTTAYSIRRKIIYEYHRVNFNRQDIQNWTVIYLRALPTCFEMDNCNDCLTKVTGFDCKWCPKLNMCSTGTFRHRQNWLKNGCEVNSIEQESSCRVEPSQQAKKRSSLDHSARSSIDMGVPGIIGILIVIALFGGLGAWGAYAYRNPHSTPGQMLIRYRPSQWSWRRGEARYTAATIHM
ncbi:plexin domain-containing protein 2 isoform X2 [Cephus cinctus]|uniref:Plexin domain-containing protein 2 isoform X2 n=1 Tax=Cephus cinctus TaxID=211228 RepID=A0AAJ7W6E3_CEPCN|nr:plexin domain-containing protein 2 isoform X2 [Cephus cinctus]